MIPLSFDLTSIPDFNEDIRGDSFALICDKFVDVDVKFRRQSSDVAGKFTNPTFVDWGR